MKLLIKNLPLLLFFLIIILSLYFRLKPIYFQNIPYTYDQGRDFLKAQEIVLYKNPTFIGPTTGIMGIYHGAWWYYILSVAFIFFNGFPQGFAYFICFFYFVFALIFYFFVKKQLGVYPALFFLSLCGFSPYLISISTFVISSGFTIPFIFLLLFSLYQYFKKKKPRLLFFIFLSAGLIFEAEIPFGLFLIPSLILTLFFVKHSNKKFSIKNVFYSLSGLIVAYLPRILFEIKNNFIQTKTFINFVLYPKYYSNNSFLGIFGERLNLLKDYYLRLFDIKYLGIVTVFLILLSYFYLYKKLLDHQKKFVIANLVLILFIFFLSLFYKDNFWPNYFEGFSILYLPLLTVGFYLMIKYGKPILKFLTWIVFIFIIITGAYKFYKEIKNKNLVIDGLIKHQKVIEFLYKESKDKTFCLKIYTPPVIPYTYQYLIEYYSRVKKYPKPTDSFVNNQCLYIIEDDPYQFRIDNWRKENIPENAFLIKKNKIFKDIVLEKWQTK